LIGSIFEHLLGQTGNTLRGCITYWEGIYTPASSGGLCLFKMSSMKNPATQEARNPMLLGFYLQSLIDAAASCRPIMLCVSIRFSLMLLNLRHKSPRLLLFFLQQKAHSAFTNHSGAEVDGHPFEPPATGQAEWTHREQKPQPQPRERSIHFTPRRSHRSQTSSSSTS